GRGQRSGEAGRHHQHHCEDDDAAAVTRASHDGLPSAVHGGPATCASQIVTAKPTTGSGRLSGSPRTQNNSSRRARPVNGAVNGAWTAAPAAAGAVMGLGVAAGEEPAADGEQ